MITSNKSDWLYASIDVCVSCEKSSCGENRRQNSGSECEGRKLISHNLSKVRPSNDDIAWSPHFSNKMQCKYEGGADVFFNGRQILTKSTQCASDCDSVKLITCGALLITFYWGQPFIEKMCGSHQKRHKMPRQVDHIYPKSNTNLEKSMHCRASLSLFKCGSQPAIWRKNTTFLLLMYSHRKISTEWTQ